MKHSRRKKRGLLLGIVFLALLCIGGMELLFCKYANPALFARLTAPVVRLAESASASLSSAWESLTAAGSLDPLDAQVATAPAIQQEVVLADPVITELTEQDGQQVLTGGNISMVFYDQGAEAWAGQPYGTDTIGPYGCGPTALSMVISSMTDTAVTPTELAAWAVEHGHWAKRGGSYLSLVSAAAKAYGLDCVPAKSRTADTLCQDLAGGGILVALMGKGHFTNSGHFIVLRGVTLQGEVLVADPNSQDNSLMTWDPQLILDELSASRSDGAPLWLIRQKTAG